MKRINWKDRISNDPSIHHGTACIKGTRIPISMIVGSFADGMTPEEIQQEYPQLTLEDVYAALSYAADIIHQEIVVPFP
ncbi:MAG: DUF433 domain-containing protein [Planctomycetes bacterium]|nr:DUF433 domain-containing protein [Planctomycetota bacterium]